MQRNEISPGGRGVGMRMGRKLAAEDLQLILLALLEEQPSHGYELIKQLAERSSGFYNPSSGMVYPALAYLEDVGHAVVSVEGTKKRYRLTDEGSAHLARHRGQAERILAELAKVGARMAQVRRVFEGEDGLDTIAPGTPEDLMLARYGLKQALHQVGACEGGEAIRIAAILRRATAEILGG
ncbi:PadR family transcriptional regulator [Pigmentiphaga kullae]|uniref:PadR family transcriptional regulator n=1 Tax=Pigmentiphaga kullae TaxID=151784 RepID=A0A4Q7NDL0_9BURK|nr:PadR family transcriptional regulator [Pigmentiphaga kullae]RZS81065.1 PadR family transcriptional regulator [Pigmentiphaga kullae]